MVRLRHCCSSYFPMVFSGSKSGCCSVIPYLAFIFASSSRQSIVSLIISSIIHSISIFIFSTLERGNHIPFGGLVMIVQS